MAVYLCAGALVLARDDIGTWIAVGFLAFATLLGQAVWEGGGLVRSILPLYAFAFAAVLGGLRAGRSASARQPTRGSPRDHRLVDRRSAPIPVSARSENARA